MARGNRGEAYRLQRDYDKAMADEETAIRLDPKLSQGYLNRGAIYAARGDYKRAIEDQTAAIALDAYSVPALLNRGEAYRMSGDLPHALDDQNEVIHLTPKLPDAYLSRGLIFQAMDRPNEAIADFDTAIRLDPTCSVPMSTAATSIASARLRGCAGGQEHRDQAGAGLGAPLSQSRPGAAGARPSYEAIGDYDTALSSLPSWRRLCQPGGGLWTTGDLDNGLADAEAPSRWTRIPRRLRHPGKCPDGEKRLCRRDRRFHQRHRPRSRRCDRLQQPLLRARVPRRPRSRDRRLRQIARPGFRAAVTLNSRGYVHLRAGQPDLAIADYDAALKLEPKIDTSLFGRGVAHAALGDKVKAAADLAAARALNPDIDREMARIHVSAPDGM